LPVMSSLLFDVLAPVSGLPVREALDKMPLEPGAVYLAPPDYHLLVEREHTIALSRDAAVHFSRPAIDVTFESAAAAFGPSLVGILLTGANEDGAAGLAAIAQAGGRIAVQDPASAHAPEMPLAALAACHPELVADPVRIASWLRFLLPPAEDV
jgi:two-component system chemotaxis response regulator CheB